MAKRIWHIRMTVELNDPDYGGRPASEEYYEDQEVPYQLREWWDGSLEDRDDGPKITWSEFTRCDHIGCQSLRDLRPADTGEINIIRGTG